MSENYRTFIIENDWSDDLTFCAFDRTWVNDGRGSAHYATRAADEEAFNLIPAADRARCVIESYEYEIEA